MAFAKPFRLPDFFLLSGLLLGRVIDRPWRRYLDTKVSHFYYFYVLWFSILFLFFHVRQSWWEDWRDADQLMPMFFCRLFEGSLFPLWFIHSLPFYFVITRLTRRVPWCLALGVLLVLHSLVTTHRISDVGVATLDTTAAAIGLSIVAYRLARSSPLKFLYVRPDWARFPQADSRTSGRNAGST